MGVRLDEHAVVTVHIAPSRTMLEPHAVTVCVAPSTLLGASPVAHAQPWVPSEYVPAEVHVIVIGDVGLGVSPTSHTTFTGQYAPTWILLARHPELHDVAPAGHPGL